MLVETWTLKAILVRSQWKRGTRFRKLKKGHLCYKIAKNMAEVCLSSSALWKAELVRDIIGYLAEEIFFFQLKTINCLFLEFSI